MLCLIRLDWNAVGLHSLCRSGAMYLQSIGIPLYKIQLWGTGNPWPWHVTLYWGLAVLISRHHRIYVFEVFV